MMVTQSVCYIRLGKEMGKNMKRFFVNIGLASLAMVFVLDATTVKVESRIVMPSEFDAWVQESNEEWAKAGYTTVSSSAELAPAKPSSSNSNNSSSKATTCDHTYEEKVTKEAICSEPGEMISICTKCGSSYKSEISATGKHNYEATVTVEAACTSDGEVTYTCTDCGDTYTEAIPATGHTYDSVVTKKETCTEEGVMTTTCAVCGDTYTEVIAFIGHIPGDWVTTKEAGWFSEGEKEQTCAKCGELINTKAISSRYPIVYLYVAISIAGVAIIGIIVLIMKKLSNRDKI